MSARNFSISAALNYGWQMTKPNLLQTSLSLILVISIQFLVNLIINLINPDPGFLSIILKLIRLIINLTLNIGLLKFYLKLTHDQTANFTDLFTHLNINLLIKYFIGSILYLILISLGFILLIIPGIIMSLGYSFSLIYIVDLNLNPIRALKDSWAITRGIKLKLLLYLFSVCLLNLLGALTLGIGLLITIPISMISFIYLYRTLNQPPSPSIAA